MFYEQIIIIFNHFTRQQRQLSIAFCILCNNKMAAITYTTTAWQKLKAYLDLLNHIMIFAVTIYISYVCYGYGPSNSSLHVWLCTIGVSYRILLMA